MKNIFNFKNRTLKYKLLVSFLASFIIIYIAVIGIVAYRTNSFVKTDAKALIDNLSQKYAIKSSVNLNEYMVAIRIISQQIIDYEKIEMNKRRQYFDNIMTGILEKNEKFLSLWVICEPSTIDNLDKNYINKKGSTGRGNYSPTFFKFNGEIQLEENVTDTIKTPLFSSDYYTIPKNRKMETILDPYYYSYNRANEDSIFQTNLIVPLIKNNKVFGVAGVDVPLTTLQKMMDSIKPYDGSYAMMVSNEGMLVTYPEHEVVGRQITDVIKVKNQDNDIFNKKEIIKNIKNGNSFSFEYVDDKGETVYVSFAPVIVGNTQTPWSVGIVVPLHMIMAKARMQLWISILVSLAGLIFITCVIVITSKWILSPVTQTTQVLKDLSLGKINTINYLENDSNDELGEMSIALKKVADTMTINAELATQIGEGIFDQDYSPASKDDLLGVALLKMKQNLQEYSINQELNNWMQKSTVRIIDILRGEKTIALISNQLLSLFAEIIDIKVGAIYINDENNKLSVVGSYAYDIRRACTLKFDLGEGLLGQVAKEKRTLIFLDVPKDYMVVQSGLGKTTPKQIVIIPLVHEEKLLGAIELGFLNEVSSRHLEFLDNVKDRISIGFNSIKIKEEMDHLLQQTIEQSEELQLQQEELQQQNEELRAKQDELEKSYYDLEDNSNKLKKSEESLQKQQEELKKINEELETKSASLKLESLKVNEQNQNLEKIKTALEEKAKELELSSKYKSEFLANMSHELRTPLNSLLILSKNLQENNNGTFDEDQLESLDIIHQSGNDLLKLINDILDLSKVEAGKMNIEITPIDIDEYIVSLTQNFKHMADQKKLVFEVLKEDSFPEIINTDEYRLRQVLNNLISNAIKFTETGTISIKFFKKSEEIISEGKSLNTKEMIGISVKDTGIGIRPEKSKEIFEAFQQADGSTSRKYGGTGLGLSISKKLIELLGGDIILESEPNIGSVFTIYLPIKNTNNLPSITKGNSFKAEDEKEEMKNKRSYQTWRSDINEELHYEQIVDDDRDNIKENEKSILIIEDDIQFANILKKESKKYGFKIIVASTGSQGLYFADTYSPSAIILDVKLPDADGMMILDELKKNLSTRHIPIHMMSAADFKKDAFANGAIGFTAKPVTDIQLNEAFKNIEGFIRKKVKELIIVEDNDNLRKSIKLLLSNKGINITGVANGKEAQRLLKSKKFDCVILDIGLPDISGLELLKKLRADKSIVLPPVIIYTGRNISKEENAELEEYSNSIILKDGNSKDRLINETTLFLHKVVNDFPENTQDIIKGMHDKNLIFRNKKVLIVDDEMRNLFALTKVLKEKEMHVIKAENGQVGLDRLKENPDIDLVLMDIMMPVMDGYQAIMNIRKIDKFKKLPIIALTAKAMKKDRSKCMEVGASDYLAKPIEIERLSTMMKVWLYSNN